MSDPTDLNISDIQQVVKAVRVAQSRGAFQLEESAALLDNVRRLESAINHYQQMISDAQSEGDDNDE